MKKYAVIGGNVTNSLSPAFNKEFAKLIGIDITYETINSTKATFNQDVRDFFESGGSRVKCNCTIQRNGI